MKNISLIFVFLLIISCQNDVENNLKPEITNKSIVDKELFYSESELSNKVNNTVTISCSGGCDCKVTGTSGPNGPIETSCLCDDCIMEITFERSSGKDFSEKEKNKIKNSILNLELYKSAIIDLNNYVNEQYKLDDVKYDKIDFIMQNNHMLFIFYFTNKEGVQNTVLYSQGESSINSKEKKTYRIDCIGSCECREIYSFETNSASCSCSDCQMIVEEL